MTEVFNFMDKKTFVSNLKNDLICAIMELTENESCLVLSEKGVKWDVRRREEAHN